MIKRTEFDNGAEYTLNGNLHREDGPAMELSNGDREWWNNGFLVEAPVSHVPEEKRKTESEDLIYKSPLEPGHDYICEWGDRSNGEKNDEPLPALEWWERSTAKAHEIYGVPRSFVDCSRIDVLEAVVPVLIRLSRGTLLGNHNCFLLLGERGAGKTHLCRSLTYCNAVMSTDSTCSIYLNCNTRHSRAPFSIIHEAMSKRFPKLVPKTIWNSGDGDDLLYFLIVHKIRVFLVMDEVEVLYRDGSDEDCLKQLQVIGNWSQQRPVVVLATGNSPVLRTLFYALPGNRKEMTDRGYGNYLKVGSLNDRKFRPLDVR